MPENIDFMRFKNRLFLKYIKKNKLNLSCRVFPAMCTPCIQQSRDFYRNSCHQSATIIKPKWPLIPNQTIKKNDTYLNPQLETIKITDSIRVIDPIENASRRSLNLSIRRSGALILTALISGCKKNRFGLQNREQKCLR